MKKLTLVLFTLLALLVQSCDEWPPGHGGGGNGGGGTTTKSIVGEWMWQSSEGGIFPMVYTPENQGFQAKLTLTQGMSYALDQTNNISDQGSYKLGTLDNRQTITLETSSMRPNKLYSHALPVDENFVSFRGSDTLVLSGTGADMLTYTYVRSR
jgi:hypothetical protein